MTGCACTPMGNDKRAGGNRSRPVRAREWCGRSHKARHGPARAARRVQALRDGPKGPGGSPYLPDDGSMSHAASNWSPKASAVVLTQSFVTSIVIPMACKSTTEKAA